MVTLIRLARMSGFAFCVAQSIKYYLTHYFRIIGSSKCNISHSLSHAKDSAPRFGIIQFSKKMKSLKTVWLVTFQLNRGAALSFWDTYSRFVTDGRESNELSLQMHARGKITEDCLRAALKRYRINAQLIIARNGPADVA